MMVDSWNRHWPLRRIGFSFWKGKFWINKKPRDFRLWARESVWQCLALDVENESKTHIFQNQRIKKRENSDAEAIVSFGCFWKATTMIEEILHDLDFFYIPGGARFLSSALRFTLVCIQKLCHLSIRLCFIRHSQLCKENIFKLFNGTSSPRGLGKREVTHHVKEWPTVSHVRIQSPFQAMPEIFRAQLDPRCENSFAVASLYIVLKNN